MLATRWRPEMSSSVQLNVSDWTFFSQEIKIFASPPVSPCTWKVMLATVIVEPVVCVLVCAWRRTFSSLSLLSLFFYLLSLFSLLASLADLEESEWPGIAGPHVGRTPPPNQRAIQGRWTSGTSRLPFLPHRPRMTQCEHSPAHL